ncbi:MAG: RIP metalloprotease RseP [Candidatus Marinimicrobia bacterium]|nr:RIP metalloprotease RseP [Candidatus Neomarinimicrobiota bacterium]
MVLFLFGLTVFVHELGHFLVARRLGLVTDVFAIGFGKALWQRQRGGVTYRLNWIPFGGYVALPQMDPGGARQADGSPRDLPPAAPWKRLLVSLAGVTGNVLFAVFLAYVVYWGGQAYAPQETNIIGYVQPDSEAAAAGLEIGDRIVAVNDQPVTDWETFIVEGALGGDLEVTLTKPDGSRQRVALNTTDRFGAPMIPGLSPYTYCYVLRVVPEGSAAAAGIESGDRIVALAGQQLFSREHMIDVVDQYRETAVPVVVERDGVQQTLQVTPRYNPDLDRALIGIEFNPMDVKPPGAQIKSHALLVVRLLRALATPSESKAAAGSVGGPFAILFMFWLAVQSSFMLALSFTCLVNVNLAVLNLLPIPVLDGGHVVFALWEMITRRPVSRRLVDFLGQAFMILLIAVFVLLSYRDLTRQILPLFRGRPAAEAPATEPPPETPPE